MSPCNLCGSTRAGMVYRAAGAQADADILRCLDCGHRFLSAWTSEFEDDLYAYYAGLRSREDVYNALNAARHQELLASFAEVTSGRRLLDVGCGAGQMVDSAIAAGWDALGIDLAAPAIEVCQRFSVPCRLLDFFDPELDSARFDVIHMSELIEHVPNPRDFVSRAAELLVRGGLLYMTTPNFDSLARRALGGGWTPFHREHVSYFTEAKLRGLLDATASFRAVSVQSRNLAPAALALGLAARLRRAPRGPMASNAAWAGDQTLRRGIAGSPALNRLKDVANRVLAATHLGESLVVLARRA